MRVGVPKETAEGERRVAVVPDVVRRMGAAGHEVIVEPGAGEGAGVHRRGVHRRPGATIGDPWGADVVAKVVAPNGEETGHLQRRRRC